MTVENFNQTTLLEEIYFANGVAFSGLESTLEARFHKRVTDWGGLIEYPTIKDPNSKWRVSSAWQKAVRRGDEVQAKRMGAALIMHDPEYFLRRINVLCLEDVGLAQPLNVAEILCMSGKKVLLTKLGLPIIAQYWSETLAAGVKDRTLCELVCATDYGKEFQGQRDLYRDFDYEEMTQTECHKMLGEIQEPFELTVFLRYLAGTDKFPSDHYAPRPGNMMHFVNWMHEALPTVLAYIAIKGSKKGTHNLWIPVIAEWRLLVTAQSIWTDPTLLTTAPLVKGVPAYAYDMHTLEGKKAIAYFRKACEPIAMLFEGQNWKASAMEPAMFIADSGLLNQFMAWPGFYDMLAKARAAELGSGGLTYQDGMALVQLIQSNIHQLNEIRAKLA